MNEKKELSADLKKALEDWADENLRAIGISKDRIADFEKWRDKSIQQLRTMYTDKAIELFLLSKDNRKINSPDGYAKLIGEHDDHTMEILIKVENGIIIDSSFQTNGCKGYAASGGMVTEMIKGKSIDTVKNLTSQDIINALGGLPKENNHCAKLAENTLKEALKSFAESQNKDKF